MNSAASAIRLSSPIDLATSSTLLRAGGGSNSAVPTIAARLRVGLVGLQGAYELVDGLAAGSSDGNALQSIQMAFVVGASGPDDFRLPLPIRNLLDPKIGVFSKRAVFCMCAEPCDGPILGLRGSHPPPAAVVGRRGHD